MRRLLSVLALLAAVGAQVLVIAGPAHAWEVHISITGAGQVTETTEANLVGSGCVTSANNPTGQVGAHCYPGDPAGPYNHGWTVRLVATPKPGYRFVHWQSDGTTSPVICDGANGSSTYSGTACQFATWANLQTRAVFEDVTAPTMDSLNGPNQVVNGATTFTFAAQADPTVTGFECRVANVHDWVGCTSGRSENPAASGTYTFEVRAVDASGNKSGISTWDWTVDKTAPETSISLSPSGTVRSTSATFEFTSNESGIFQCSLDSSAFTTCGSPKTYSSLGQGPHNFAVRAVDVAGNPDLTPVTRTWTVDTVAPDTTITTKPTQLTNDTSADFGYTSEPGATFACTLDGSATPCASSYNVGHGEHTFTVAATDGVGNTDASPASYTWVVDTQAPETTITSAPPALTNQPLASFTFTSTETGGARVCTLDTSPIPCTGPYAVGDGEHTFTVTAADPAGNVDPTPASHTWTVDTAVPDTAISGGPSGLTNQATASFTVDSTEPDATLVCELDGVTRPCGDAITVSDGEHTFTATATDAAGNTDPTPASHTWTVDTAAPTVDSRTPTGRKVSRDAKPSVTFSEAMQESTVEAARLGKPLAFYLTLGGTKVAATVTYTQTDAGAFRAVLDPANRLRARKEYRVVLSSRAMDLAGNPVAGTSWRFRTRG